MNRIIRKTEAISEKHLKIKDLDINNHSMHK